MAGIVERIERANGAGQWRAATDEQMQTDAQSARPLQQPGRPHTYLIASHCPKMMWSRRTQCATCHRTSQSLSRCNT